jgi:hypothetical protein
LEPLGRARDGARLERAAKPRRPRPRHGGLHRPSPSVEARIEPAEAIVDRDWRWFVGLDAEATRIGNALWRGEEVGEDAKGRTLGLFRLRFGPGAPVDPQVAGHPVYLLLAVRRIGRCA